MPNHPTAPFQPKIEMRDPKSITPYFRNTKQHSQDEVEALAGIIAEFDFDVPIVVDAKGVVIKGHKRRKAALQLGLKQVPVIVRSDLTEAQLKAARMADNQVAWAGKADHEAIKLELESIADLDADLLKYSGFDPAELDKYLDSCRVDVELGERQPPLPGEQNTTTGEGSGGGEQDEDGEGSEEEAGGKAQQKPPGEKFPLAIVLTGMQKQEWDGFKEVLGEKNDTKALIKIMQLGVRLK